MKVMEHRKSFQDLVLELDILKADKEELEDKLKEGEVYIFS